MHFSLPFERGTGFVVGVFASLTEATVSSYQEGVREIVGF
jgi:hypothetical protein